MLKHRLFSSLILIIIIILALFFLSPLQFATIILVICILATWEWGKISGCTSYFGHFCFIMLSSLLLLMILFLLPGYCHNISQLIISIALRISLFWWIFALLLVFFYPSSSLILKFSKILRLILGLLIIVPFFCGILALRVWHYYDNHHYNNQSWLLYIILLICGADSGAYIFGKLFGKHKLAPKVSPGKTWQGFIGGLLTSTLISLSYSILVNSNIESSRLLIFSVIAVLASVLGDLTESMFKREAGIKDSSHLIPGHGGILDRIDSFTAAVPIFTSLLLLVNKRI